MDNPFELYNNTGSDIVLNSNYTVPAYGIVAVAAEDAANVAKLPLLVASVWSNTIGISIYGYDQGFGVNSSADIWLSQSRFWNRGILMKLAPGQFIPFWFKLWDDRADRYVLAYVTDESGNAQSGSPYSLTYTGSRGIYTGLGPSMGSRLLVVDYQAYLDAQYTQRDGTYLPQSDWIEPEFGYYSQSSGSTLPPGTAPQFIFLNSPVSARLTANRITAFIQPQRQVQGVIKQAHLTALLYSNTLQGIIETL